MARNRKAAPPTLGFKAGFADYELGKEIGRGGNGVVRLAKHKASGRSFAVKSIPKELTDPGASERKKANQIPYLKREVEVLLALRGSLDVATLEEVYEDATHVHLVLELCSGGELLARTKGRRHYSERTVASFLRAVLRTVAQCHAQHIIHRDIKPENFLLLSEEDAAPLKAVDFGLAVFFDPARLPVTGLNPEGTPWYLAPECCRAKWHDVSDVWAVGVMACYLLTGSYPFLDRVSPKMPDLARTLRSICFEELDLGRPEFAGLSAEASAFITALLRPSATEALRHPFLKGKSDERAVGKPLDRTVRFAQSSLFKRTVLEHIAADLLTMHFAPDPSTHGASVFQDRSVRGGRAYAAALSESARGASREGSTRGGQSALQSMASAAMAAVGLDPSVRGGDRSVRGGDRSMRGGDRSVRGSDRSMRSGDRSVRGGDNSVRGGDRSVRGGAAILMQAASLRPPRAASRLPGQQLQGGGGRSASMYLPVATPYSHRLAQLFDQLQLKPGQKIDLGRLQKTLQQIGYHLKETEVEELFGVVDVERKGEVSQAELAAGLIDWKAFQDTYKDRWLECARRAFAELDGGHGELGAAEIAAAFGGHLSPYEVDAAVHQALLEATGGAAAGSIGVDAVLDGEGGPPLSAAAQPIDFERFLGLLQSPSTDDLELFEDRLSDHTSRQPSLRADDMAPVKQSGGGSAACCTIS